MSCVGACTCKSFNNSVLSEPTASSYGGLDEGVQLLVSTDSELQVARSDALHLQIFGSVARQLQHLETNQQTLNLKI